MTQIESSNLRTQVGIIGILTHPINQKTTSLPLMSMMILTNFNQIFTNYTWGGSGYFQLKEHKILIRSVCFVIKATLEAYHHINYKIFDTVENISYKSSS